MIKATILGSRLKHAVAVLRRVDDEAILKLGVDRMMCRVVDPDNAMIVQIDLPKAAFEFYEAQETSVGIDLDRLAGKVLKRAKKKDIINISGDDRAWKFVRGIHQKTTEMLDPGMIRKPPKPPDVPNTASVQLSGGEFKEIVAEAADVSDFVRIQAISSGLVIEAQSEDKVDKYTCPLSVEYYEQFDAATIATYTLEYLQDIARGMIASDEVTFAFGTDYPCEIGYERDGAQITHILAPRMESD